MHVVPISLQAGMQSQATLDYELGAGEACTSKRVPEGFPHFTEFWGSFDKLSVNTVGREEASGIAVCESELYILCHFEPY